jgi:hypothetical protein
MAFIPVTNADLYNFKEKNEKVSANKPSVVGIDVFRRINPFFFLKP